MTKLYIFYTFFFIIRFCKYSVIQTRDAEEIPLRIQFQVFFLYLFDQRNGNILFEVVSWSVMQKVLAQFVVIYGVSNVALMVVESNVAFCLTYPYEQ